MPSHPKGGELMEEVAVVLASVYHSS